MDIRAQQAREHHLEARSSEQDAARHRLLRDRYVRELSAEGWSHRRIAREVGCSRELVTYICHGGKASEPQLPEA